MEFQGSVKKITYYNQENGYGVVRVEVSKETMNRIIETIEDDSNFYSCQITVVSIFTALPFIDQLYDFSGEFEYSKYGLQFRSDKTIKTVSQSEEGIVAYLSSSLFTGIGKKTAEKVYEALKEDALKLIIHDKSVLDNVDIKQNQKDTIYKVLKENYSEEESLVELLSFGLTLKMATRIIKTLGDRAISVVKENPYSLIDKVEGIAFLRADEIAFKIGIDKKSPYRLKALIQNILKESIYNNGDTYKNVNDLYIECIKIANKDEEVLDKDSYIQYLKELTDEKKIIFDDENNVYDVKLSFAENEIARMIVNHLSNPVKPDYDSAKIARNLGEIERINKITYNEKQTEAITTALLENVCIITGGPGTGKSTIIKAIVDLYKSLSPQDKVDIISTQIKLVAPTGRAAKRLREVCYHEASTIHKLLGYTGRRFTVEEVDAKLIIIDEFSMVDISLCYHLLKALKEDTKIVIVGDSDQLPAVGAGDILNDLILSKEISCIRLDKIHRQAKESTIISLAHDINHGFLPPDLKTMQHDRKFINCDDNNIIPFTIKTIDHYLNQQHLQDEDSEDDLDARIKEKETLVNDIQVLVPMYRGTVGIDAFNYYMQEHFNPLTVENYKQIVVGNRKFRVYDKVIQLINRSDKGVMNGDIGYIVKINGDNNDYDSLIVRYPFGDVEYEIDDLDDITLAYAISIHKAQGSEFKLVIVPFSFKYYIMLKKKLIYTAVTRAKKYLIMIGNFDAIRRGIVTTEEKRKTKLQTRIRELLVNPNIIFDANSAFEEIKMDNKDEDYLSPYDFMD